MALPGIDNGLLPLRANADIIGKSVYTFHAGRKAGVVKDVFFDQPFESVCGISLGKEGIFSRNTMFVPTERILEIGYDIIIIESEKNIEPRDRASLDSFISAAWFQKREVVDRGIKLAISDDVMISESCRVLGISFLKVLAQGKIASVEMLQRDAIREINVKDDPCIHIDLDKF
ncbi:MAG: hypothetical protein A2020_01560 [Lentisphaerae bacterium GWF2_45_14]|nr:MAG: hypothetical protein A2020_01560 [Lentisphaerae bacterium GWF2_45_14]